MPFTSREQFSTSSRQDLYPGLRRLESSPNRVRVKGTQISRIPIFLKPGQVEALISVPTRPRDIIILRLLYYGAMRISEVLALRVEDIDFPGRGIKVCHALTPSGMPKEYKERLAPIDATTLSLIKKYAGAKVQGRLFKICKRHFQRLIKRYAQEAGIPNWRQITPHKLRHSFATHYYRQTKDLFGLKKILGHASATTTEIYAHVDIESVKERYDSVVKGLLLKENKPVTLNDIYRILLRIDKRLAKGEASPDERL